VEGLIPIGSHVRELCKLSAETLSVNQSMKEEKYQKKKPEAAESRERGRRKAENIWKKLTSEGERLSERKFRNVRRREKRKKQRIEEENDAEGC